MELGIVLDEKEMGKNRVMISMVEVVNMETNLVVHKCYTKKNFLLAQKLYCSDIDYMLRHRYQEMNKIQYELLVKKQSI